MEMKLEEIYYYAKEIRGLSEVLFLATNSPESIAVHCDDAMSVLVEKSDQLVDEIERVMNANDDELCNKSVNEFLK